MLSDKMEGNIIDEQLKILEIEKCKKVNEIFIEIMSKLVTYEEDLKKCYNEIEVMRIDVIKIKLENSKLQQEFQEVYHSLSELKNMEELKLETGGVNCELDKEK